VLTPLIIAADKKQGFLILSDFGDQIFLNHLNPETAGTSKHNQAARNHSSRQ